MRSYVAVPAVGLAIAALASCSSTTPPAGETVPLRSESAASSPAAGAAGGSGAFTMPDEVGGILQDAQDDIQLLDSNWQVCSQSVPSGQQVDATSEISFAAVKLSESCP